MQRQVRAGNSLEPRPPLLSPRPAPSWPWRAKARENEGGWEGLSLRRGRPVLTLSPLATPGPASKETEPLTHMSQNERGPVGRISIGTGIKPNIQHVPAVQHTHTHTHTQTHMQYSRDSTKETCIHFYRVLCGKLATGG